MLLKKNFFPRILFIICLVFFISGIFSSLKAQDYFPLGIFGLNDPPNLHLNDDEKQLIYGINTNYLFGVVNDEPSVMIFCRDTTDGEIKMNLEDDPTRYSFHVLGPYHDYHTVTFWPYISESYATHIDSSEIDSFVTHVNNTYGSDVSGLGTILLSHQGYTNDSDHWPFIQYASVLIQQNFGDNVRSTVIDNTFRFPGSTLENFFATVDTLDVFQFEYYPFYEENQPPWNTTDSSDFIGNGFQTTIVDNRIINNFNHARQSLDNSDNDHTTMEIIVQTHRSWIYSQGSWSFFRRPTQAEIWLQAFLALSRNFKGVHSYIYFSSQGNRFWGLLDESSPRQELNPYYSHVAQLYDHLSELGPELLPITVDTAFTWEGNSVQYINTITGDSLDGSHRTIEVSIFEEYNNNDYFMLINRRCSRDNTGTEAFPQHITVTITPPNGSGTYQIRDLYSDELYVTSDNTFRDIEILAGRGRVFELRRIFDDQDETWTGTVNICSNITVPQGRTLTISPNSNLNFRIGTELDVYGKLIANGTSSQPITMDRIGSSGRWSKIRFYDSADDASTVKYCNISNANYGIYCDRAHPTIQNCIFSNCYYGIVGYYAAPEIGGNTIANSYVHGIYLRYANGYSFEIHDNTVTQTTTNDGVRLYKSSPDLYQNTIANNSGTGADGIYLETQSSCKFYHQEEGFNNIHTNGQNEVHAYYYSDLTLGTSMLYHIFDIWNRVVDPGSGVRIKANNSCYVTAEYNWWGGYPPQSSWFLATNGSTIDYTPALSSDPLGSGSMLLASSPIQQEMNESSNLEDMLQRASLYRWYEKYDSAFLLCDSIIQAAPETETAKHALSIWWDAFMRAKKGDFLPIAEKIINAYPDLEISGLASCIIADIHGRQKEFEKAYEQLDRICTIFPKTLLHKYALFDEINAAINDFQDIEKAKKLLSELEDYFPGDELIEDLKIMLAIEGQSLGMNKPANDQFAENQPESTPASFKLETNFPNPFNPETLIQYQLPEPAHVTLTVYNLLGQKIRTLIDKKQQAGYHSVHWDGRDEMGSSVASGMYFYVLRAGDFMDVKKMMLLR